MDQTYETPGFGAPGPMELSCLTADNQKIAQIQLDMQARLRRQRHVEHLHRLGPLAMAWFIGESEIEAGANFTARLEAYAAIDPAIVSF